VELLDCDFLLVAEAVAPPSAQIVYAAASHALKQFPSSICGAYQLFLFLCLCFLGSCGTVLWDLLRYYWYAAEVALALQYHGFVRVFERILAKRWLRCFVTLRQLLRFL
jgi:hypothetical protein